MLSKAQANHIADELLEQARASRFGFTDPSGMPVAPFYQCHSLRRLPQGMQSEIVRKASLAVSPTPAFIAAVAASVAAMALIYAIEPTVLGFQVAASPFMILAPLAPMLLRAVMIRRAVRRIADRIQA